MAAVNIQVIIKHNQESRYWNDIIKGNIKPHFFDIINEEIFLRDLENIQQGNAEKFSLPIDIEKKICKIYLIFQI